ncbi:MAG: diphthamide biosynthesis enzyme Dph2 [Thermoplasmatales archaeon]|nr:diphthamide biosynthesis enzyme Dph2 [Thermoplasmatales archaeon]
MKLGYYRIDEKKLVEEAKDGKTGKIGIKLPEGLSKYASDIIDFLKKHGIETIFISDSCYGACDFFEYEGIDKIIFVGEVEMPYLKKRYRIGAIEAIFDFDENFLEMAMPFIKEKKIGLVSITPFIHKIEDCGKFFEKKGYEVFVGKKSRRTKYDGQILGCDFSSAKIVAGNVDCFVFIGDGFFHPVGLYIATKKDVICANPLEMRVYKDEIKEMAEKIIKKRHSVIYKAMDSKNFGIIVGRKIGQKRLELAKRLKRKIEEKGKKAYLICMDEIDERINYLDFDCYVSTACPRVAIDDAEKFKKPLLTPFELEILFGERESYLMDEIY